jgi:hypothetical protein
VGGKATNTLKINQKPNPTKKFETNLKKLRYGKKDKVRQALYVRAIPRPFQMK